MTESEPKPDDVPRWRRVVRALARLAAYGVAALIAGAFAGQAIRDRSVATALLMYIPLPLVGTAAVLWDAMWKGRSIPRLRFGLSMLGLAAIAWSAGSMMGPGISEDRRPGDREVSVLHWNVLWGGGPFRSQDTWAAQRETMQGRHPDLIVLSEAPPGDWLDRLVDDLGPGASHVGMQHDRKSPFWYRLAVCSRGPLRKERELALPGGSGMSIMAEVAGRRLRLLVVDGISKPTRSRLPFLRAIAEACREADASGRPFDLVLGDFNTPSRSLGFDELTALDYRLAGRSAPGWRGTFPAWFPAYDIDHVWVSAGLRIASCLFFNGPYSDHRGQVVRLLLPEETHP